MIIFGFSGGIPKSSIIRATVLPVPSFSTRHVEELLAGKYFRKYELSSLFMKTWKWQVST